MSFHFLVTFTGASGSPVFKFVSSVYTACPNFYAHTLLSMHRGPVFSVILPAIIFSFSFFLVALLAQWVT